jgi:hypothetical protein
MVIRSGKRVASWRIKPVLRFQVAVPSKTGARAEKGEITTYCRLAAP